MLSSHTISRINDVCEIASQLRDCDDSANFVELTSALVNALGLLVVEDDSEPTLVSLPYVDSALDYALVVLESILFWIEDQIDYVVSDVEHALDNRSTIHNLRHDHYMITGAITSLSAYNVTGKLDVNFLI